MKHIQFMLGVTLCLTYANCDLNLPLPLPIMGPQDYTNCLSHFKSAELTPNPDAGKPIDFLINKYGYHVQRINVTTADGYILGVYRIPYSPKSPLVSGLQKRTVLLKHGFMSNGQEWIVQYQSGNLAMSLADAGFDVFLANSRGTKYSQGHTNSTLTVDKKEYWDFSIHELGIYDVPAVMDMITNVTGNQKMFYVGHSLGCAEYAVAMSERPELNSRIYNAFLFAPAVFVSHGTSAISGLAPLIYDAQYLLYPTIKGNTNELNKMEEAFGISIPLVCALPALTCGACANLKFALFGFNPPQVNYTTIPVELNAFPDTIATKVLVHLAQIITNDEFCQFDYGFAAANEMKYGVGNVVPPCYNLLNVAASTYSYCGLSDNLVSCQDANKTANSINPTANKGLTVVNDTLWNHFDFASARYASSLLYNQSSNIYNARDTKLIVTT